MMMDALLFRRAQARSLLTPLILECVKFYIAAGSRCGGKPFRRA
jgi:hypothetical protein